MKIKIAGLLILFFVSAIKLIAQDKTPVLVDYDSISVGAMQHNQYLPMLKNRKVAVLVNHGSMVGDTHLVDLLLLKKVNIVKIFSPEHGFRGEKDAGEKFEKDKDTSLDIPIVSLYGKHKKPTKADLHGVDVLVIDLQDVGVRFYTYISTMSLAMEACAENGVTVVVLDRPNPNGYFVDGPVLKKEFKSFVGMHPVPVVYGMTIGEYALMVNGEKWLANSVQCKLKVIKMTGYSHNMIVKLKVNPSPNLPDWKSVYLYPSLCFFEGTDVSVGRGTEYPFQVYGHPKLLSGDFAFKPHPIIGRSMYPKLQGENCYGQNLAGYAENYSNNPRRLNLQWLISAHRQLSPDITFFSNYFDKLAGTDALRKQIIAGKSEKKIRSGWKQELKKFKKIRENYLLYR